MKALQGHKTYIVALLAAAATFAKFMDYLDEATYQTILGFLGAGAVATLAAKGNRIEKQL